MARAFFLVSCNPGDGRCLEALPDNRSGTGKMRRPSFRPDRQRQRHLVACRQKQDPPHAARTESRRASILGVCVCHHGRPREDWFSVTSRAQGQVFRPGEVDTGGPQKDGGGQALGTRRPGGSGAFDHQRGPGERVGDQALPGAWGPPLNLVDRVKDTIPK